jgi:hypothetical protein
MTLLLDDQQATPGTHVLMVGVGQYPFLKDGSAPEGERLELHMNMGQLSSPPHSVDELARWFVDGQRGFHNPERPLRSLQVLCSSSTPLRLPDSSGQMHDVAGASTASVHRAILDFMARGSRNEENLLIFYFCGHGLAFSEVQNALLLADFGSHGANPMTDAIAFDELRQGLMGQCSARYQLSFIDACRTLPTEGFTKKYGDKSAGQSVVAGGISRELRDKVAPVFFATGLAAPAYGVPEQASLFTQGLLSCFRGVGSRDEDDQWRVTVPAIAEGINKSVQSLVFERQPQFCQPRDTGQGFVLHQLRGLPEVIVKVCTRDEQLLAQTILVHTNEGNVSVRREPLNVPWWLPLPTGRYRFEALSPGEALLGQREKHVSPPGADVVLP